MSAEVPVRLNTKIRTVASFFKVTAPEVVGGVVTLPSAARGVGETSAVTPLSMKLTATRSASDSRNSDLWHPAARISNEKNKNFFMKTTILFNQPRVRKRRPRTPSGIFRRTPGTAEAEPEASGNRVKQPERTGSNQSSISMSSAFIHSVIVAVGSMPVVVKQRTML